MLCSVRQSRDKSWTCSTDTELQHCVCMTQTMLDWNVLVHRTAHSCTAALSGTVQTWKWAHIDSHPGYCYCGHKSSQLPIHCPWSRSRISLSTRQPWQSSSEETRFASTNQVETVRSSWNNMSSVSAELFRRLCGLFPVWCTYLENCMKGVLHFCNLLSASIQSDRAFLCSIMPCVFSYLANFW